MSSLRWIAVGLLLAACNRRPAPTEAPAPPQESARDGGLAGAAPGVRTSGGATASASNEQVHDFDGVKVSFRRDGRIEVQGKDRFGASIDTVYDDAGYLRNALPTLRLSLPDSVVDRIESLVGKGGGQIDKERARPARERRKRKKDG